MVEGTLISSMSLTALDWSMWRIIAGNCRETITLLPAVILLSKFQFINCESLLYDPFDSCLCKDISKTVYK